MVTAPASDLSSLVSSVISSPPELPAPSHVPAQVPTNRSEDGADCADKPRPVVDEMHINATKQTETADRVVTVPRFLRPRQARRASSARPRPCYLPLVSGAPARARVCSPFRSTTTPLTTTCGTPSGYACGCSNVAVSRTVAGLKITTSAA